MAQRESPYPYMTVDEYLAFERTATVRYEYIGGMLYAMAGASLRHNRIVRNLVRCLAAATEGTPCEVFFSDVKLRIADSQFYYPDVMIVCGPDVIDEGIRTDPCAIIEVLSPSTESIDQREKLFAYRQVPSLQAYVMVFQDQIRVQRHYRDDDGAWQNAEVAGVGNVPLPCPDLRLTLDDIYAGIEVSGPRPI